MFEVIVKFPATPDLDYTKVYTCLEELRQRIAPRFWGIVSDPDFHSFQLTTSAPYSISIKKI